jgi:NADPH:quinone reductase-like Zn-dependent oxidoreductase
MKAIVQDVYGSPEVLRLAEVEPPQVGDDDVLVRVAAAGVDAGVWHMTAGLPYLARAMGLGWRAPRTRIRGTDFAGRVEAVGANVTTVNVGDEVYGSCDPLTGGAFAELVRVQAGRLAAKPANLSFAQAAAVPVSGVTALQALRDAGALQPGQTVLVTGAGGGVGSFAVQIAKALGAGEVTGVCGGAKVDLVRSLGADHVINYADEDVTSGARQYDLILDTAGRRPLTLLRRALAPRGTLAIVGGEGGDRWLGGFDRQMLRAPALSLVSDQRFRSVMAKVTSADLQTLRMLIEAGTVAPVVDRVLPLAHAAEAVRYTHAGLAKGKVVLGVAET